MIKARDVKYLLIASLALCLVSSFIAYRSFLQKREAQTWVDHTYQVIEEAAQLNEFYHYAGISQRDYSITRQPEYLKRYQKAFKDVEASVAMLRQLTIDNNEQTLLIDQKIKPYIKEETSAMNQAIASTGVVRASAGKDEVLQESLTTLTMREKELLKMRYAQLLKATSFTEWWMYTSFVLIGMVSIAAFITIHRGQKQNETLLDSLKDSNELLETRVLRQTEEIRERNKDLHLKNQDLAVTVEELQASEEEVRSSFDFISSLKEDLEKNERLYRLLADNAHDMITIVGEKGLLEYVSPGSRQVIGYEPEELVNTNGFDLVVKDDLANLQKEMARVMDSGKRVAGIQFRMKRKDGREVWVESQATPLFDEEGRIVKRQTTVREISKRKKVEEELLVAKQKAEEATQAKSQFLSTMSHEIRTPMNAVIGLTNILLRDSPKEDQVENLKLLRFSAENLLTIINDILDFNKIEAGKIVLEHINFNLYELLLNVKNVQEKRADEKGISLHFAFDKDVPLFIKSDPVRLVQIMTNLVTNAIKFTEKGYVELSVSRSRHEGVRHTLQFRVKDSGIGIEPSKQKDIFDSFSQATPDITRKYGGTGLGLAITKKLVDMMEGSIVLQSSLGYGSEFIFELTVEEGNGDNNIEEVKAPLVRRAKVDARVLLVEDNRVNQIVASNFLNNWGITIDYADNGRQAVELVKSKLYQLILMDLQMPEMDGYTAARLIRAMDDPYFKQVPIIALTAEAMIEIKEKAFQSGMNSYISKPFDPEDLKAKIFSFLPVPEPSGGLSKSVSDSLDLYSEGNPAFKKELADLLIKNIQELQASIATAEKDHGEQYRKVAHKVKTTLRLLGDREFEDLVATIGEHWKNGSVSTLPHDQERFAALSDKLIEGLTEELNA